MQQYEGVKYDLKATMDTHLIDLSWDAIKNNDYNAFIKERCKKISEKLNERIKNNKTDEQSAAIPSDEEEEEEEQGGMTD